jgi:hypothetical protein
MYIQWNWGAFLLCPFWCLSHHVWIGLISVVPMILISLMTLISFLPVYQTGLLFFHLGVGRIIIYLIMFYFLVSFVVGIKGNEWAKATRIYQNTDHFNSQQYIWCVFGFILSIPIDFQLFYSTYQLMNLSIKILEVAG